MSDLLHTLCAFQERVNTNPRVAGLIRSWRRSIVVKADGSGHLYTIRVAKGRIEQIVAGDHGEEDELIMVSGRDDLVHAVFSGTKNPAKEFLNGTLTVLGDEADKIKLDAICVVLWGEVS